MSEESILPTSTKLQEFPADKTLIDCFYHWVYGVYPEGEFNQIGGYLLSGFLTGASVIIACKDDPEVMERFQKELHEMKRSVDSGGAN